MFTTLKFSEVKQNTEKKVLGGVFWTRIGLTIKLRALIKSILPNKDWGLAPRQSSFMGLRHLSHICGNKTFVCTK